MAEPAPASASPSSPADLTRKNVQIIFLGLLVLLLLSAMVGARARSVPAPPSQAGLKARALEMELATAPRKELETLLLPGSSPWDRALGAVLAAEACEGDLAARLALEGPAPAGAGEAFRRCWRRAYQARGDVPDLAERAQVLRALRDGYAGRILMARVAQASGEDAGPWLERARSWAATRQSLQRTGRLAILAALLGGAVFATVLILQARSGRGAFLAPPPPIRSSGRDLLRALLLWLVLFLLSGTVVHLLLSRLTFLEPLRLPLGYLVHALPALALLMRLEGWGWADLGRRLGSFPRALSQLLPYAALAFTGVTAANLLLAPFLGSGAQPGLEEILGRGQGILSLLATLLTLVVLAPCFEEILFRGWVLPWLRQRLAGTGPRAAALLALLATALLFGLSHLQPWNLPTLCSLGAVLGLALLRSGELWTSILLHAMWNGGVYVIARVMMG